MAPFQYQPYQNPYAGTIAALIARQNDPQAQAAQQSGQAWGQAIQGIGQSVAAIPQQMRQQEAAQQEQQIRQAQLADLQQRQADLKALDQAYLTPGGRDQILNALPGHLRPTVMKQFTDADESAAKAQKALTDAATATNDYIGFLASGVQTHGYDPSAAQIAISHFKDFAQRINNPALFQQAQQFEQQIQANPSPEAVKPIIDGLIAQSQKVREVGAAETNAAARVTAAQTGAARLALEQPKIEADTAKAQAEVAGALPPTPAQQETARHNKIQEQIAAGNLAVAKARENREAGGAIDPQLTTYWADQLVRDPANLKMVSGDKPLLASVRRELATRGVNLTNLDASSRMMAIAAKDVEKVLPTIEQEAKQLDALGLMGAAGSRWRDFLSNKIGASALAGGNKQNGELLGKFRADVGLLKTALMKAHVGSRGGTQLLDEFNGLLNADKTDIAGFLGALEGVKGWMSLYANRLPDAPGSTQPAGADTDPLGILGKKK